MNEILGTKGGGSHTGCARRGSQSDDAEDEDSGSLSKLTNEDWLLSSLPNIPHFAVILPWVYPLLRRASVMETNLSCLQSFFHFLTHYPPEEKIYESSISLSSVIVDRFDIVGKLFCVHAQSPTTMHGRTAATTSDGMFILGSLLSMLRKAMEMAINSQTMPQLSSSEDFLLVSFPTIGKKTIIHTSLIQAIMLLLTFDLPPLADRLDYKYFLDQWFPVQEENRPEAHAVESKEKASFPHPSILPYMLLSSNPRILSASVASSSPSQLCSFVKQFGCPLPAMEKVLESLDCLCEDHDSNTELRRCVLDPAEMIPYVEVHILRGAISGKAFLSFLQGLASSPPAQPVTSIASVFENEGPSSVSIFRFDGHQNSLTSSTVALVKSASQSYAKFTSSSLEDLERMIQQSFSTSAQGIKGGSLGKTQEAASDLVSALRHCINVGVGGATQVGGASSNVGGTMEAEGSLVSRVMECLNKLLSNNKTKKSVLGGMMQSRHAVSILRLLTKISQCSFKNGDSSHISLFRSTLQIILQGLESYTLSSGWSKFTVFSAAVKSSAKQLGVEHKPFSTHPSASTVLKLEPSVTKSCQEISEAKDPFKNKAALVRLCHSLVQAGLPAPFEQLLSCVIKRAICLGKEQQCIQFLFSIKNSTADSTSPIVLKFFPSYFTIRGDSGSLGGGTSRSQSPEDDIMETNFVEKPSANVPSGSVHLDIYGLLVDWLEVLDPEVLALSPEHSTKMVFGRSNTEQLSAILATSLNKDQSSSSSEQPSAPRFSSSLLMSGQGYLQNRLTNNSSWPTLVGTMKSLLDLDHLSEW